MLEGFEIAPLTRHDKFGRVLQASSESVDLLSVLVSHRSEIDALVLEHGALWFRGLPQASAQRLSKVMHALGEENLPYLNRSTPRTEILSNVFTATEYPADQTIPLHCENAYQSHWPLRLVFHCVAAAESGGETTLADMRAVSDIVGKDILDTFRDREVLYVRNFGDQFDIPWQTAFQTDSPDEVARYCQENGIDYKWTVEGRLRTKQRCQGTASHPDTGEEFLFNQANLFHISSLGPVMMRTMLKKFGEESLPRHAYFGDGSRLPEELLGEVRQALNAETVPISWQSGDVLLLDNMRVAHGRNPFAGRRVVLVAMARAYTSS